MKRIFILMVCIFAAVLMSACNSRDNISAKADVEINMPRDDSVNGYRTETPSGSDNTVVSADSVEVDTGASYESKTSSAVTGTGTYCVNKNSKVFHKSDCKSVSIMKEENRLYFDDRQQAVENGYTPCQNCNP